MRVLVGYNTSMHVVRGLQESGHDVWTCDLRESEYEQHLQMDIWMAIHAHDWDAFIFHPTCTYLTVSAAWAFKDPDFERFPGVGYHQRVKPGTATGSIRRQLRQEAIENFFRLMRLKKPVVCENPCPSFLSRWFGTPQTVQPYNHGDDASKRTGLWVNEHAEGFVLVDTEYVQPRLVDGRPRWGNQTDSGQNRHSPKDDRWLIRSQETKGLFYQLGLQFGRFLLDADEKLKLQVA